MYEHNLCPLYYIILYIKIFVKFIKNIFQHFFKIYFKRIINICYILKIFFDI